MGLLVVFDMVFVLLPLDEKLPDVDGLAEKLPEPDGLEEKLPPVADGFEEKLPAVEDGRRLYMARKGDMKINRTA